MKAPGADNITAEEIKAATVESGLLIDSPSTFDTDMGVRDISSRMETSYYTKRKTNWRQ